MRRIGAGGVRVAGLFFMAEKNRIIDALGERALLLPSLINAALAANDQTKYLLTLLQTAKSRADRPDAAFSSLRQERLVNELDDEELDRVVERSELGDDGLYRIPRAGNIVALVMRNIRTMLDPVEMAAGTDGEARRFAERYQQLAADGPTPVSGNAISGAAIAALTSGEREQGDSRAPAGHGPAQGAQPAAGGLSRESIDGARVYGLHAAGQAAGARVHARRELTQALKFDHPGLGTTATAERRRSWCCRTTSAPPTRMCWWCTSRVSPSRSPIPTCTWSGCCSSRACSSASRVQWEDTPLAPRQAHGRGRHLPPVRRQLQARDRERAGAIPGVPRFAPGVPDRLEPRAQAPAPVRAQARRASPCSSGRRTTATATWPFSRSAATR